MSVELSPKAAEIATYARALLASGGYDSFSYADISEVVKISKASIHHHFPSKSALVRFVVAQYREEARAGMAALDRQIADPLAELNAYVDYWSTCIRDGSASFCICALLAVELPRLPREIADEVRGHFDELSAWLTTILKKGVAKGQFRLSGNAATEAKAFMGAVHGAMLSARAFGEAKTFESVVRLSIVKLTSAD